VRPDSGLLTDAVTDRIPSPERDDKTEKLLSEMLEVQRAHLEEYKRVTSESLRLQRHAVESQAGYMRFFKPMLIIAIVVIAGLIAYVLWLSQYVR